MSAAQVQDINASGGLLSRSKFDDSIRPAGAPLVMRGLVSDWALVKAANQSDTDLFNYLKSHDSGKLQQSLIGKKEDAGFFFFNESLRGQNYSYEEETLSAALDKILADPTSVRLFNLFWPRPIARAQRPVTLCR